MKLCLGQFGQWKTASQHWPAAKVTQIQKDQGKCGDRRLCFPAFPQSRVFVAAEQDFFSPHLKREQESRVGLYLTPVVGAGNNRFS